MCLTSVTLRALPLKRVATEPTDACAVNVGRIEKTLLFLIIRVVANYLRPPPPPREPPQPPPPALAKLLERCEPSDWEEPARSAQLLELPPLPPYGWLAEEALVEDLLYELEPIVLDLLTGW